MTLSQLCNARRRNQCVIWLSGRHMPTAFLCNMKFWRVAALLPQLKLYKPKSKKT